MKKGICITTREVNILEEVVIEMSTRFEKKVTEWYNSKIRGLPEIRMPSEEEIRGMKAKNLAEIEKRRKIYKAEEE